MMLASITAIFSAVNGILLEPLPYADPSRLVTIQREQIAYSITFAQLREIQQQCTALERMVTYSARRLTITGDTLQKEVSAAYVSGDYFALLGGKPLLGRPILPEDTQPGNDRVIVLDYRLWRNEFGGDMGIVGRRISVNHEPYTVIGVMPNEFGVGIWRSYLLPSGSSERMWLPQVPSPPGALNREAGAILIARLKKNVTLAQANAQLQPQRLVCRNCAEAVASSPKRARGFGSAARRHCRGGRRADGAQFL